MAVGHDHQIWQRRVKFLAVDQEAGATAYPVAVVDAHHATAPHQSVAPPLERLESVVPEHLLQHGGCFGRVIAVLDELVESAGCDVCGAQRDLAAGLLGQRLAQQRNQRGAEV